MMSRFAALAALSLVSVSPAAAQPAAVTIYAWSYDFAPRPIYLRAGQPVTLTFVNRSNHGHDFTAKAFFASSRIIAGSAYGGEVDLPPAASRTVTLVPSAGVYKVHCSHFLHKQFGMTDQIVVR